MGTAVPMEIKTPGTVAGPARSALFRTAQQQRKKRLPNCWMNVLGNPGPATPALQHWLKKCSNRNSRETAAPGNPLPACGLFHSSNSWKIRNRKRKTHQHHHWLSRFLVFIFPGSLLRSFIPRTGLGSFSCRSRISITFSPFSGMGPEHTALIEGPHSNTVPR